MKYRIWYSTESFADFIIENTLLNKKDCKKKKIYESDANNAKRFHKMPDHIKKILYLDSPDLIVELDSEPIFSIEVSSEAGTGHNAFQRFARLAASLENNVPAFYIYPDAALITRKKATTKWDKINPLVFKALEDAMSIYNIPALLFYFPTDFVKYKNNPTKSPNLNSKGLQYETSRKYAGCPFKETKEIKNLFNLLNVVIKTIEKFGVLDGRLKLLGKRPIIERRNFMQKEYFQKKGNLKMSPLTSTIKVPTEFILNYLKQFEDENYSIGELLRSRPETVIYKVDAQFRGDPYPGALAAIDYLSCREGKSFEERKYNLVLAWGTVSVDEKNSSLIVNSKKANINDFVEAVKKSEKNNLLTRNYSNLQNSEIPRYYMQVRYGSSFTKAKHIRVYSYFADAIIFPNGSLWRDA